MAGHSKYKKIKHYKSAQDRKRGDAFTKALKEIIIAAKSGSPDPELNYRLRAAIRSAQQVNLPKEKIQSILLKLRNNPSDQENYEEVRYEGYSSGGVSIIIESLTNNRNRTAADVRAIFNRYGGALGQSGSVSHLFEHIGIVEYDASIVNGDFDEFLSFALSLDIEDCIESSDTYTVVSGYQKYHEVRNELQQKFGDPASAEILWSPKITIDIQEGSDVETALKSLTEDMEELDDVRTVFHNGSLS